MLRFHIFSRPHFPVLLAFAAVVLAMAALRPAAAQTDDSGIGELPAAILFVVSGGYWEEPGQNGQDAGTTAEGANPSDEAPVENDPAKSLRGYYRLTAIRGSDNRSVIFLEQIALTTAGPEVKLTINIEELSSLGAYVTDIRPEDSSAAVTGPGFAAYVYLKTDPAVNEPDTWTVFVDEFGDISVNRATN